jgi:peptidoglycan/LPS O-acetylase OafA/YrhL
MAIPGKQKMRRNFVYRSCAHIIVIGVAALAVVAVSFDHSPAVFWIEAMMVWAFGVAYTVKSGMIRALND